MNSIKFDYSHICNFVKKEEISALFPEAKNALESLKNGSCKGNDFWGGWIYLPVSVQQS